MTGENARRLGVLAADPDQDAVTDRAEEQRQAQASEAEADAEEQRRNHAHLNDHEVALGPAQEDRPRERAVERHGAERPSLHSTAPENPSAVTKLTAPSATPAPKITCETRRLSLIHI